MELDPCSITALGVVCLIIWGTIKAHKTKEEKVKKLNKLRILYKESLVELSKNKSSENKIKALNLGRELASYTRELHTNNPDITIFDEVALQNDLTAYGS